jgi:signal transduction histidine kinase
VVAALSRVPYEHAERSALVASVGLDMIVLLAVSLLTYRTVSAALAPVARMTRLAADWGAHDTAKRFDLGPPVDELTGLAATLDGLLARLSASLGHERRLTAEIAHELRTPVARIRAEAEVALRHPHPVRQLRAVLAEVVTDADHLSGTIDALLRSVRLPVRQRTQIETTEDLAAAPVAYRNGAALTLGQVADAEDGRQDVSVSGQILQRNCRNIAGVEPEVEAKLRRYRLRGTGKVDAHLGVL